MLFRAAPAELRSPFQIKRPFQTFIFDLQLCFVCLSFHIVRSSNDRKRKALYLQCFVKFELVRLEMSSGVSLSFIDFEHLLRHILH